MTDEMIHIAKATADDIDRARAPVAWLDEVEHEDWWQAAR